MKATLEFYLPAENAEFDAACNGMELANILWDVDQWLRSEQKHQGRESVPVDEVRDKIRAAITEAGMSWDCVIWR